MDVIGSPYSVEQIAAEGEQMNRQIREALGLPAGHLRLSDPSVQRIGLLLVGHSAQVTFRKVDVLGMSDREIASLLHDVEEALGISSE